ncbi:MAG: hypothetical protein U0573_06060 [Phycisphaerales bacterium]|nr:hypothetical protein [Planctomycetota bacterium]
MKTPVAVCASCISLVAAAFLLGGQAAGGKNQAAKSASVTGELGPLRNR